MVLGTVAVGVACGSTTSAAPPQKNGNNGNNGNNTNEQLVFVDNTLTFEEALANLKLLANAKTGSEFSNKVKLQGITQNANVSVVAARQEAVRINAEFPRLPYLFDHTTSFGGLNSTGAVNSSALLLRTAAIGQPIFSLKSDIVSDSFRSRIEVVQPSLDYLKLEIAKAIEITFTDGSTKIYNNDKHEKLPEFGTSFEQTAYSLLSDDPQSINNLQFNKDLKSAVSFSFSVKDNLFWSDRGGQKTNYQLKAQDILYSYLRTKLLDTDFRLANGGSKVADEITFNQTANNIFNESSNFPNEYLYPLFGVDGDALYDSTRAITKNSQGDDAYTVFKLTNSTTSSLDLAFDTMFIDSALYALAPSDYIRDNAETFSEVRGELILGGDEQSEAISGLAKEYGIYWYAKNLDQELFASPYIPTSVNTQVRSIVLTVNKNYADQDWVKSPFNQASIVNIYDLATDTVSLQARLYNGFADGQITSLGFSQIPAANSEAIRANQDRRISSDKINYTISKEKKSTGGQLPINAHPTPGGEYKFNDAYALLMYGSNLAALKAGTAQTTNHYFKGDGLTFRNVITGSFNLVAATNILTNNQSLPWISAIAPDVTINGSNQNTSALKTPRDAFKLLNSLFVVQDGKKVLDLPYQEAEIGAANPDEDISFRSPEFAELQRIIKETLDKPEYVSITPANPIEAELTYHFIGWDDARTKTLNLTVKTINALDPRLKFTATRPTSAQDLFPFTIRGQGVTDIWGWGADYDGIGTFFHGSINRDNTGQIGAFPLYADDDHNTSAFPEFVKLSKALKEGIADKKYNFKTPFADWINFTNRDGSDLHKYLDVVDANGRVINDQAAEFARFFLDYQTKATNEQLIALGQELTVLRGSTFNRSLFINDLESGTPFLRQSGVIVPRSTGIILFPQDVRFVIRKS